MHTPEELLKRRANTVSNHPVSIFPDTSWNECREEMLKNLKEEDISNFLTWSVVARTMFFRLQSFVPFYHLREKGEWNKWREAMKESPVGSPLSSFLYPESSENIIHQARHLARLVEKTSCEIEKLEEIIEVGGGYGCVCRLVFRLGFRGRYILYDLPEFTYLQEYYLSQIDVTPKPKIFFNEISEEQNCIVILDDFKLLKNQIDIDNRKRKSNLFMGMWSLSEMPEYSREKLFEIFKLKPLKYYLFGYSPRYKQLGRSLPENCFDNTEYFKRFASQKGDYKWTFWRVDYLRGDQTYLIGEINDVKIAEDEEKQRIIQEDIAKAGREKAEFLSWRKEKEENEEG